MASMLLVRGLDVADLVGVIVECVVDVEHRAARISKDGVHTSS